MSRRAAGGATHDVPLRDGSSAATLIHPVLAAAEDVISHEKRLDRLASLRQMEREYLAVRQMTPRAAAEFLDSKTRRAASAVQSAWRGARVRRSLAMVRSALGEQQRARAADAIQQAARRHRRTRRQLAELREERDATRGALVLELPLIQRRILDEVAAFRLVEAKSLADVLSDAERALADWADLRRRTNVRAAHRQQARVEARALFASLRAVRSVDPDCAHEGLSHLRPLGARAGVPAPLAPGAARIHLAMTKLAELDADSAKQAVEAERRKRAAVVGSAASPATSASRLSPRAMGNVSRE